MKEESPSSWPRCRRRIARTGLALWLLAGPLAAQSVSGVITETDTHRPIVGALLVILDRDSTARGNTVTAEGGRFFLPAPASGRYRLRMLRIGYEPWLSPPVDLAAGKIEKVSWEVPAVPVVLPDLSVEVQSPCGARTFRAGAVATLLEESRKAIGIAEASLSNQLYGFSIRVAHRRLDTTNRLLREDFSARSALDAWPVRSLPADTLSLLGYVQARDTISGPVYYGPDAQVIFSESFLATHCFRIRQPEKEAPDLVGLAFTPVKHRPLPDIEGVMWLDRRSAELRFLEFHYTGLGSWVPAGRTGGGMQFITLPTGARILSHWSHRAPVPELSGRGAAFRRIEDVDRRFFGLQVPRLNGYVEEVGDVTEVRSDSGTVVWRP